MKMRRALIVESLYRDFASSEDLMEIDRLYANGQKGPAEAKMLRAIRTEAVVQIVKT